MTARRSMTAATATALLAGGALVLAGAPALAATAQAVSLSATGSGDDEVPPGSGQDGADLTGSFQLTPAGALTYTVRVSGNDEPIGAGHIHRGAAGANGDVVVPLDTAAITAGTSATAQVDPALAQEIIDDPAGFYLNVHSASYAPPAGVARAQLSGSAAAPGSIDTGSGGQAAPGQDGSAALAAGGAAALVAVGALAVARR
ncbi:MAG: hypothetical protein AVDCRST_MAG35-2505, partial [uncultured Quadrisphaera sp.]